MATPSSTATTPSPRPRYLHSPGDASSSTSVPSGTSAHATDDRERVVQKLRTQAELNKLALNLRARLSYANFKVKNNSTNNTLLDLDSQLHAAAKHAANGKTPTKPASGTFFGIPGSPSAGQSSRLAARRGSMAPPPPVTASAAQSLFSSLLAPPPAKRARTIHNPDDPPVAAPEKAVEHVRTPHRTTKVARTPDSHAKSKTKKGAKDKAGAPPSGKGKGKGKARQRVTAEGSFEPQSEAFGNGDIDVEAAKTLTHFLLAHRPSVSATAGSPRSSISAGSDPGSAQSFPHYAQSATRLGPGSSAQESPFAAGDSHSAATPPHSPALSQPSPALSHAMAYRQSVHPGSNLRPEGGGTPKMASRERVGSLEDTDAAGMLLLMATSPSPARPTSTRDREARDAAAFQALRGGSTGLKGRVLFPTYEGGEGGGRGHARTLSREMSGSFASVSSVATEPVSPRTVPARRTAEQPRASTSSSTLVESTSSGTRLEVHMPMLPTITPPTPTDQMPSQLLPAAPHSPRQGSTERRQPPSIAPPASMPPHTPNASFSLSDYVNVSPSPAAALQQAQPRQPSHGPSQIGRRLFEEHPAPNSSPSRRVHHPSRPPPSSPSPSHKSGGLSAGVDLV
ncbi:uncharacterized protein TRAVEDRAFT_59262 [Trametes versicolor FP-101664 SS1]|uniref:uncharacterized protein n=1 Tax=Trametes versicolor (strain FP-101664) TaxID=717944 RepID=UPI0004623D7F|nr:uncharacterized protein TRAVEDRAFT_59262 [Trametes versicolor FP-101664 SS1]EIW57644.1 hypothetical protein TRAVEDRAFT_59262 [Trametes versicolor FP-101664 SS1]